MSRQTKWGGRGSAWHSIPQNHCHGRCGGQAGGALIPQTEEVVRSWDGSPAKLLREGLESSLLLPIRAFRARGQSLTCHESPVTTIGLPCDKKNPEPETWRQAQKFRAGTALTWHSLEKPPVILLGELRPVGRRKQERILRGDVWDFQKGPSRQYPTQSPVSFSADLRLRAQAVL